VTEAFNIEIIYGHMELKQFNRFEKGRMVCYGYSVSYDRNGVETKRTKPSKISSIGWNDGSPFTKKDLEDLSD
jgi:hypothetical protein